MRLTIVTLTSVLSRSGLGLIGVSAHVVSSSQSMSNRTITTGTLAVMLSSPGATGNGMPTVSLPSATNARSTLVSQAQLTTITNNGSLTANENDLRVTDGPYNSAGSSLAKDMYLCLCSDSNIVFNDLLSADKALGNMAVGWTVLLHGGIDSYTAVFYAGDVFTGFGKVLDYQYRTLDAARRSSFTPYPVTSAQPDAGSPVGNSNKGSPLSSDAQGGSDTVSVTLTYSA